MASECLRGSGGTNDGMGGYPSPRVRGDGGGWPTEFVGDGVEGRNPPANLMISDRGEKFPLDRPEGKGGGGDGISIGCDTYEVASKDCARR